MEDGNKVDSTMSAECIVIIMTHSGIIQEPDTLLLLENAYEERQIKSEKVENRNWAKHDCLFQSVPSCSDAKLERV